jgi:hypothetical protein
MACEIDLPRPFEEPPAMATSGIMNLLKSYVHKLNVIELSFGNLSCEVFKTLLLIDGGVQ